MKSSFYICPMLSIDSTSSRRLGYFGNHRTHAMLRSQYWWIGMHREVMHTYAWGYEVCDKVRLSFNTLSQ